jgi:hypothetical protein
MQLHVLALVRVLSCEYNQRLHNESGQNYQDYYYIIMYISVKLQIIQSHVITIRTVVNMAPGLNALFVHT